MHWFGDPRAIKRGDAVAKFDCGVVSLNNWLKNQAIRNQDSGASRTFVSICDDGTIAGYYCLSAFSVAQSDVGGTGHGMPDPVPVTLIGRLAVDVRFAGHGLGRSLLRDAVLRAVTVAQQVGSVGILVHANEDAIGFYKRFGFQQLPKDSSTLMITMNDARVTIARQLT